MSKLRLNITMSLDGFVVPMSLGGGARLFDNLGEPPPKLRQVQAVEGPGVTHIRYAPRQ
jgi:hypothetical protein